jgi:hypothetical protein
MSFTNLIITGLEIMVSIVIVYGVIHENELIEIEQDIKRIIKGNYKRIKRSLKK